MKFEASKIDSIGGTFRTRRRRMSEERRNRLVQTILVILCVASFLAVMGLWLNFWLSPCNAKTKCVLNEMQTISRAEYDRAVELCRWE